MFFFFFNIYLSQTAVNSFFPPLNNAKLSFVHSGIPEPFSVTSQAALHVSPWQFSLRKAVSYVFWKRMGCRSMARNAVLRD